MPPTPRQRLELAALLTLGIAPFYLNGFYNPPLATNHRPAFWAVEIFTWVLLPTLLLLLGARRGLFTRQDLGLTTRVRDRDWPWALPPLLVVVAFLFLRLDLAVARWAYTNLPAAWATSPFRYADVIPPPGPSTGWWRLLVIVHFCVTAGVVEELYYRAAFDRLFPRGPAGGVAYVLASSTVFAGAHWEAGPPNLAEAFAVGLFAATVFRLTRNLWPLILGHVVTDWHWFAGG